jgi:hypothetical protein
MKSEGGYKKGGIVNITAVIQTRSWLFRTGNTRKAVSPASQDVIIHAPPFI